MAVQQFGSFFNKPVEVLIRYKNESPSDDIEYLKEAGLNEAILQEVAKQGVYLGHKEVQKSGFVFLNHGAFGGSFDCLQVIADKWRAVQRRQPLLFIDRLLLPTAVLAVRRLSRYLHCPQQSLLLFPNATYGLNCLLSNIQAEKKIRKTIIFTTTYGSVKKMAHHYTPAVHLVDVPIAVVKTWTSARDVLSWLDAHVVPHVAHDTLVLLEGISSNSVIKWPADEMAAHIKQHAPDSTVIIDAAHELGMLKKDLSTMAADAWVTNGHKWFGTPSGVGVVVMKSGFEKTVKNPLIVSHGSQQSITSGTIWHGHVDYSSWLTIPWAVDLWEANPTLVDGLKDLTDECEAHLCNEWGTSPVYPSFLQAPIFRLIELPSHVQHAFKDSDPSALQDILHHEHAIECPVKKLDGVLYMRVSVFCYNKLDDAKALGAAVMKIAKAKL